MATPTNIRKGGKTTAHQKDKRDYFKEKRAHVEEHIEEALRMVGDQKSADRVARQRGAQPGTAASQRGATRPQAQGAPGGDFMSNEDIRAFCEDGRKKARQRAVERALDAQMLEGRLANIPDTNGTMAGARARARRVTRWLKRIAQAEKLIAKWYAALYSSFEREYDAQLMKIGKGRVQQKPNRPFNWR
jgi:hypothetical protein